MKLLQKKSFVVAASQEAPPSLLDIMRRLGGNPRSNICVFFSLPRLFFNEFREAGVKRQKSVCGRCACALYVWKKLEKMALSSTCFLVVHAPLYTTSTNQALASRRAFSMLYRQRCMTATERATRLMITSWTTKRVWKTVSFEVLTYVYCVPVIGL